MKSWLAKIATATGGALAVLSPLGRCPVCLSSATGVAGSVGLGVLASKAWFLPLMGGFLLLGLGGTIASARTHRRWYGVVVTAIGSVLLIAGRILAQTVLVWAGAVLLAAGLVFDLHWKRKLSVQRLVQIRGIREP